MVNPPQPLPPSGIPFGYDMLREAKTSGNTDAKPSRRRNNNAREKSKSTYQVSQEPENTDNSHILRCGSVISRLSCIAREISSQAG
jgi:hypothetical protein